LALSFSEDSIHVLEHSVGAFVGVNLSNFTEVSVVVDDWHRVIHVSIEALLKTVHVIVSSSTPCLPSLDASFHALVFRALEKQHEEEVDLLRHLCLPALQVVFVAGKAVDKEFVVTTLLQIVKCIA
jgi:hypothetical protein